ncbi:MAG: hypothetical protein ACHQRM_16145 [Bacteroidia bacterium]
MNKIRPVFRWSILVVSLILPAAYFLPIWSIQLWAPQYPEGLEMKIWINKLSGSVDIINDLNHYIGMGKINIAMFPEFGYMVYLLGAVIVFSLLTFVFNKRILLYILSFLFLLAAIAALVDFYNWGYYYGHHLNPMAAIRIEGMSYQPPLIGYKVLLNFTALSMPDIGGWILFGSGALVILFGIFEFIKRRKNEIQA